MAKSFLLLSFLFISITIYNVSALKCYACTVNIGDLDQRCVTDPDSVQTGQKIVNCNYEYCTSKRVEYKDPPNKVKSMDRGCTSDPQQMNTIIEDDESITYYRACRKDLCNGGNGKGSDGGVGLDPETGLEGVLYVNGTNSAPNVKIGLGVTLGVVSTLVVLIY